MSPGQVVCLPVASQLSTDRISPPVFIMGCPRSGTSLLYHLLLSAGGFAEFRTQMNIFDVLEPIHGDLGIMKNKKAAMRTWLGSKAFAVSGLDAAEIEAKVLAECHSTSDFLRIIMEEIASKQGADRWIDSTPTNIPHMLRIHRDFPDAQIVHIIRDARDVVLSLDRRGWTRPLPWDRNRRGLLAAGLYWEWIVRKGRKFGSLVGRKNYLEVKYEDLVLRRRQTLGVISEFIGRDLDCDRIQRTGVGSSTPLTTLTSFAEELRDGNFSPVERWRNKFPPDQLPAFENLVGNYLRELGYTLSGQTGGSVSKLTTFEMRLIYRKFYECKQWVKTHTPLTRMTVDYAAIQIDK